MIKSLLFLCHISGTAAKNNFKTDICIDEIQFLANALGSENFVFGFTRLGLGIQGYRDLDPALTYLRFMSLIESGRIII